VYDVEIFVGKRPEIRAERIPLAFEKDVDGDTAVAFPPPNVGKIQEKSFEFGIVYVAKVVDSGYTIVAILYYTYILHTGMHTQRDKRILGC
jgi:hypothetical protein